MHAYYIPETFKYFKYINSFNSHTHFMKRCFYFHYFTDGKTEAQESLSNLLEGLFLLMGGFEYDWAFECMESRSKVCPLYPCTIFSYT